MSKFVVVCSAPYYEQPSISVHGPFRDLSDAIVWLDSHERRCPLKQTSDDHDIVPLKRAHKPEGA